MTLQVEDPSNGFHGLANHNGSQQHTYEAQTANSVAPSMRPAIFSCKFPITSKTATTAREKTGDVEFQRIQLESTLFSDFCLSDSLSCTTRHTLSETLHAAWALLLHTYLGNEAISFATSTSMRNQDNRSMENSRLIYHTMVDLEKSIDSIIGSSTKTDAISLECISERLNTAIFIQEQETQLNCENERLSHTYLNQSFQHVRSHTLISKGTKSSLSTVYLLI